MYTSKDRLSETIALQQRLLKQSMMDMHAAPSLKHTSTASCKQPSITALHKPDAMHGFEWKAKRRPDGSIYITRRPLRNRILKAREEQLNKERCTGLSTDDDAASELKTGRFWNRHQRKDHVERARQRKLMKQQAAMAGLDVGRSGGGPSNIDEKLLSMVERKQRRKDNRQLLDKFTTIQE